MSNLYTQQENTWAAMISNCRITNEQIEWACEMIYQQLEVQGRQNEYNSNYIPTFGEIVKACNEQDPPYDLWFRESTEGEKEFFNNAATEEYGNWKIVGIYDDNDNSGMYAVAIETGEYTRNGVENGVILSVRGTEPTTLEQKYLDLVQTDLNIINSDITEQEKVLYEYIDGEFATLIEERQYSNLATTGHSLGGYLSFSAAAHITLMNDYAANIFMQGTNIDGPGVTEENLAANAELYASINDKLTHYHYSYVGSILTPICDNYISITGASDSQMFADEMNPEVYSIMCAQYGQSVGDRMSAIINYISGNLGKHSLASLQFDGNGNYDTEGDWLVSNEDYSTEFEFLFTPEDIMAQNLPITIGKLEMCFVTYIIYNLICKESESDSADIEYDMLAELLDVGTNLADKDDLLQIFGGGVVQALCDRVNIECKLYNDRVQLGVDLINIKQTSSEIANLSVEYSNMVSNYIKLITNPTQFQQNWFLFTDSMTDLKEAMGSISIFNDVDEIMIDMYQRTTQDVSNTINTISALVKQDIIFNYKVRATIIIAGTQSIINEAESWDSLEQYMKAQQTFISQWNGHYNKLENLSEAFKDDSSTLYSDFQTYSNISLQFISALVVSGVGSGTSNNLGTLLVEVKGAQQNLMQSIYSTYTDSTDLIKESVITIKDYITNTFKLAYTYSEKEIREAVLEVGNSLCEILGNLNLEHILGDWSIKIDGSFNDATDYIYGLTGGVELRGDSDNNHIYGGRGNNGIYGEGGNDVLYGGDGNDAIKAGDGDDVLYGDSGSDALYGENGNDSLTGGTGNDAIDGGTGRDTYYFNLGDGTDTIYDFEYDMSNPKDKIVFGTGILAKNVMIERINNDLLVKYSANDSFVVKDAYRDHYGTGRYFVESMEFEDGTVWSTEDIANKANIHIGTTDNDYQEGYGEAVGYHQSETFHMGAGHDTVMAGSGDDLIYGEEGDDSLYGGNGDDKLIGGQGNDYIEGGEGADSYGFVIGNGLDVICDFEFNMSNPNDKIVFGAGITPKDVVMQRVGDDLIVKYSANDSFVVKNAYRDHYGTGRYFVESMEYADGTVWSTEDIANKANIQVGTEGDDRQNGYWEAVGYHQGETFHMLGGNDEVWAGEGDDTIHGDAGNDVMYGENGNDTLIGGAGNDYMEGGSGQDVYRFNLGDGTDTVHDFEHDMSNPKDKIVFGKGIKAEDVTMERNGNNLVVKYSDKDSFTVTDAYTDYYGTGKYFVESMEFEDGTVWSTEDIANKANIQVGTEGDDRQNGCWEAVGYHQGETFHMLGGNDEVWAGEGDDTIHGDAGNDVMYGENGNDSLIGGAGNDYMEGGSGQDVYRFNLGDGTDTVHDFEHDMSNPKDKIVFGKGIKAEDVTMERNGNNLVVKYSDKDSFTVTDAYTDYYGTGKYFVESMEFEDGTVWSIEDIANKANIQVGTEGDDRQNGCWEAVGYHQGETFHMLGGNDEVWAGEGDDTIHGDAGNDVMYGENGNDTLIGGAGNDYMEGGSGSDTYVIGLNDGNDVIRNIDYSDGRFEDKILYGEGINVDDISISRSGNDLIITNAKTEQTTVVSDAYSNDYSKLHNLEFYDKDTAVIDYASTSLNITYADKEEVIEMPEEEELISDEQKIVVEPIPEPEIADEVQDIVEEEVVEDKSQVIVDEEQKIVAEEDIQETASVIQEVLVEENIQEELLTDIDSVEKEADSEVEDIIADVTEENVQMEIGAEATISDTEITKMTDLMIQEMAGSTIEGVIQVIPTESVTWTAGDSLLWVEK